MKYGISLPNAGPWGGPGNLAQLAHLAEVAGWDGMFLEDYIVWQGHGDVPTYDPWVSLAAMAIATRSIRLGTMVTPVARRRPWKLAREAVTLDHLSSGRLTLGVGSGDMITRNNDFSGFGEAPTLELRAAMLDEGLDLLDRLWSGGLVSFDGGYYRVDEVQLRPRPIQQPRIPIWVGGGYPNRGPTRRSLRWDGSCLYKGPAGAEVDWTPEDVASLRAQASAAGCPDDWDIAVGGRERRANVEAEYEYVQRLADAGATWWVEYLLPHRAFSEVAAYLEGGPVTRCT